MLTNIFIKTDLNWAWDKQNLGKSLYDNFGYEGVFVLSRREPPVTACLTGN